jgi:hypothetical protein
MLLLTKISAVEIAIVPRPAKIEYSGMHIKLSEFSAIIYDKQNNEL